MAVAGSTLIEEVAHY